MIKADNKLVLLGETNFRSNRWRFGIKNDDRRRHMYVVGSTGMGKTELLKNMAIQDIEAGRGIAFIDPHGDSADDLLDHIPAERIKDVVYFDPGDLANPIAFNVMEKVDFEYRHLVASGLLGVFKKIFGVEVWSGRMEYILNNTILALLEYPDATLLGINKMLSNKEYRKKVVDNLKDPIVRSFWVDEFAKYTERMAAEATPAIQNKIGQFISNNLIRNIIGQVHSTIDVRKIMDEGKIFIVNISRGKIGEDASRLLGALLVTKIQLAAMSRVDTPEQDRRDFYLYVDEFQHFATESFANILSEARKYHLSLIMAHQYIKQMEEHVMDAVFGNVGTIISFRVGAEDGEFLEKWFQPDFLMNDIVNLGKYNMYLKLMIDGVSSKGFSAQSIPPLPSLEESNREAILEHSRKTYATPREKVEILIAEWAGMYELKDESKPKKDNYSRQGNYPRQDNYQRQENYGSSSMRPNQGPSYPEYDRPRPQVPRFDRPEQRFNDERYAQNPRPAPRVEQTTLRDEPPAQKVEQLTPKTEHLIPDPAQKIEQPKVERPIVREKEPAIPARPPQPIRQDLPARPASVAMPSRPLPQPVHRAEQPLPPKQTEPGGISLRDALKQGPVNFSGRRIDDRKEKAKISVNTDELRKVLEEAMGNKD